MVQRIKNDEADNLAKIVFFSAAQSTDPVITKYVPAPVSFFYSKKR